MLGGEHKSRQAGGLVDGPLGGSFNRARRAVGLGGVQVAGEGGGGPQGGVLRFSGGTD